MFECFCKGYRNRTIKITQAEKLDFWNQWKVKCAVLCCDEFAQEYLSREIYMRFWRFSRALGVNPPSQKDVVTEFDGYLIERASGTIGRTPKRWKNVIWKAIEENPEEAPLKIINGKLLGRNGVLWDVFRRWRKVNAVGHVPIDGEREFGVNEEISEVDRELQNRVLSILDFRERIALLAMWFKISLDDFCVREAMQVGKDACYRAKNSLCEKLRRLKVEDDYVQDPGFMEAFVVTLKESLKSENSATALLNKIKVNTKN